MSEQQNYICKDCKKTYKSKKYYETHIQTGTCDYLCKICNHQSMSKSASSRHKQKCSESAKSITNNNVNNIHNGDNNNTLHQNVVLLQPFDIDHYYMNKEETIGSRRSEIVCLLRAEKYVEAYECLFKEIHGNEKHPERHNIYLPHMDRSYVMVFKGFNFMFESIEKMFPRMYYRLKHEMDWLVKTMEDLDEVEKSQLRWNIQANWRQINELNDPNMKQILRNNKDTVLSTLKNKVVKIDTDMLHKWDSLKNMEKNPTIPSPMTINSWMDKNGLSCDKNKVVTAP